MPQTDQTFTRHNTDDSELSRPTSDFTAAVNIALDFGGIRPQRGNVLVPYDLPATGLSKRLGGFEDGSTGVAISFLYNDAGFHRLIRYDALANGGLGAETTLLEWSGLNLTPKLVMQGGIVDGLMLFLDGKGDIRAVNLKRAANGEYTQAMLLADPYLLHLVPQPPAYAPLVARSTVAATTPESAFLLVQDKCYQFCLRWRYVDGGVTPFGPRSNWLDVLESPDTTLLNAIEIKLPPSAIPPMVQEIEVLAREAGSTSFQVARTLRRTAGVFPNSLLFYGVMEGGVPTASEQSKLFQSLWPAEALVLARSRAIGGNFNEGYITPLPAFTAVVQAGDITAISSNVYLVFLTFDQRARDGAQYDNRIYILTSDPGVANYPNPLSTYRKAFVIGDNQNNVVGYSIDPAAVDISYAQAFTTPEPLETSRTISLLNNVAGTLISQNNGTTFLPRSTYPVAVQFYDAQGHLGGASLPKSVFIPQPSSPGAYQRIRWALPTTDAGTLNTEIPAWATSYHIVVGRNTRASYFLQGRAAAVLSYFGEATTKDTTGATLVTSVLKDRSIAHEKLFVDIGAWPAAGQGYVWTPDSGDVLRFVNEKIDCKITGQRGDYLQVSWRGVPVDSEPLIEIYTPATVAQQTLYERGPRYPVIRVTDSSGNEQRSYSIASGLLDGDCFIGQVSFSSLFSSNRIGDGYMPPAIKSFGLPNNGPTAVIRMVPLYRAVRGNTRTAIGANAVGALDGSLNALLLASVSGNGRRGADTEAGTGNTLNGTTVSSTVSLAVTQGASTWLDMSWGGRPTQVVPLALQQVRRSGLIRFSGVKVQGTLLNGLSQWEALNQYEDIPQEQGPIRRMSVADQTSTDGTILLVNQERGDESISLGQSQIKTADGAILLALTSQVIGGSNALRGGYGCTDPAAVVAYAGKLFFPCRRRAEVLRYDRNGLTPLGFTHKNSNRLKVVFARYAAANISACYDPRRKEYLLTFHATDVLPDLTLVYSDRYEAWADEITCSPEAGMGVDNELVTWLGGQLWRHTPDAPTATFFGVLSPVTVTFITSQPGGRMTKVWRRITINSYGLWLPTRLTNKENQLSRVLPSWLKYAGGIWRAALRRDETTPGQPSPAISLHEGDELQSAALKVTLTAEVGKNDLLTAASLEYYFSSGQGGGS